MMPVSWGNRAQWLPAHPNWVALAACVAVGLLMIFPAVTGVIASCMALAGILAVLRGRPTSASERHFAWLCLAIPAAYILNMALNGWAMNLLDRPMHLAYAVALALLVGRHGLGAQAFFHATVGAALAAGAIAFSETMLAGQERVFGLGGRWNAVPFGNFSLLLGCCALAGGLSLSRGATARLPLLLGCLAFAAGVYASMMSGSRGGWLALPVLVVIASHASAAIRPRHRVALAAALLVAAMGAFAMSDTVRERVSIAVTNVTDFIDNPSEVRRISNASGIRLAMWRWGIERFREAPLTGIGYANFSEQRDQAVADGEMPVQFSTLANLHNEIISSLAFGGLPSLIALLAFWVLGVRFFACCLRRSDDSRTRYFATTGLMTVVGTMIFAMTEGLFGTRSGTYGLLILLALPAGALFHLEAVRQGREQAT